MDTLRCLFYKFKPENLNATYSPRSARGDCPPPITSDRCTEEIICPKEGHFCFSVWKLENKIAVSLKNAGCSTYSRDEQDCEHDQCLGNIKANTTGYCCCRESYCNERLDMQNQFSSEPTKFMNTDSSGNLTIDLNASEDSSRNHFSWEITMVIISLILLVIICSVFTHNWLERKKIAKRRRNLLELTSQNLASEPSTYPANINIKILELVGTGKFGRVHRALIDDSEEVAVKITPHSEQQIWFNEQDLFKSPKLRHPNVLQFHHAYEHVETNSFWLIVEYASKGSLYSFFKSDEGKKVYSWPVFFKMAYGVAGGLAHLHEAHIAHRDFKSKNVLLRGDLSPCITDFGHALFLDSTFGTQFDQRKKYLQVGTPRYMAPEVLECSVVFTRVSFTKIDAYALGLVLWELLSRLLIPPYYDENNEKIMINDYQYCHRNDELPPYQMPYEDVAGPQPTIESMLHIVVKEKVRPAIRKEWRQFPIADIAQSIEDTWDYDHDARISSSCIVERMNTIKRTLDQQHPPQIKISDK